MIYSLSENRVQVLKKSDLNKAEERGQEHAEHCKPQNFLGIFFIRYDQIAYDQRIY